MLDQWIPRDGLRHIRQTDHELDDIWIHATSLEASFDTADEPQR